MMETKIVERGIRVYVKMVGKQNSHWNYDARDLLLGLIILHGVILRALEEWWRGNLWNF